MAALISTLMRDYKAALAELAEAGDASGEDPYTPFLQRPCPEQSAGHVFRSQWRPVHPGRHAHVPL